MKCPLLREITRTESKKKKNLLSDIFSCLIQKEKLLQKFNDFNQKLKINILTKDFLYMQCIS